MAFEEYKMDYEDLAELTPGQKRVRTMKKKFGKDYFAEIGSEGGRAETTKPKGFAWLKIHDPKKLEKIIKKSVEVRKW